jgi:serine/threonine-protein kinase
MVAPTNPCDPERLMQLLYDRLPPARQAELEDHLQRCPHCQAKLDELAGGSRWWGAVRRYLGGDRPGPSQTLPFADAPLHLLEPSDQPGSLGRLGPYEVQDVLGRGGMGVVLKAFDPALHRPVAIKVLSAALAACAAARQRFAREARAAAAVVHEHVVTVHAVDTVRGLPYLVMEYVAGRSLQQRLDESGPLGLKETLRIGMQAASGLAAAHAQGLVHRDVKPANILLENGVERVKLTDFGLARAIDDASMTQSGVVTGTPQYMAPEQARGEAVDHRADLFSLGSTLYAVCAGHAPFRADSSLAVLRRVIEDEPRPLRDLNPDVPPWLAAVVARLHAKDPADRFQSAQEVAELLGQCLAHVQRPDALPLPAIPGAPKSRRRRWSVGPMAGVVGVSIVGLLALAWPGEWPGHGLKGEGGAKTEPAPPVPFPLPTWEPREVDALLRQTAWQVESLDATLHAPSPTPRDPQGGAAQELIRRLDALEHEIPAARP